jgi:hypothetical protein
MADNLAELLAEKQRREGKMDTGYRSVLDKPEETTTLEETKRAVTALLKGSTKGVVDMIGGWGNLYDYVKQNPEPSGLSSKGIVNAISKLGGPDLMKIQGYKGMYDIGQAGAPAAVMGAITPAGSLFSGTTGTAARAGKEFAAGGAIGLAGQQVANESPYAQLALQTLPYLVKGGINGISARKQQNLIGEYKALLPEKDLGVFNEFVLKGQGSTDPAIAADIARLTRSPKYLEMITALNEWATVKALSGMAPKGSPLTPEQSKTGIIQAIQNKLAGIRESNADSLFEKAKGYGGGQGLVDSSKTVGKIDELISRYTKQATPNAERAVQVLQSIRDRLAPSFMTEGGGGTTVTRAGTPNINIPGSKGYTISEAGQPTRTTQGAPARTVTEEVVVTKTDSLGMPYQTTETRTRQVPAVPSFTEAGSQGRTINVPGFGGTTIAGTPDVNINIPGANPYRIQQGARKLTVEEVQSLLSEFGKKASAGDNLIKDLSISDERIISSAIFGGLKDDMTTALATAKGSDKAALNLLNTARDRVSKASTAYNEAIAQGMPAYLHNKALAEISPEDLQKTYLGLTPVQRGTMREWVGKTDQAALDVLDKQIFTDFVNQAKKTNNLGVETVDLASLAQNWRALEKIPGAQDALVTSLGTNAKEFGQRMKDAELFTRKMSTVQNTPDQMFSPTQVRETQAAIGGATDYSFAKLGQLTMDTLNSLTNNGLSEEQLMKVLLTDSGKNFLKSASLSPRSEKALTDLMQVEQTPMEALGKWGAATTARMGPRIGAADQPTIQQETPNADVNAGQDDLKALLEEKARRDAETGVMPRVEVPMQLNQQ